MKFKAYELESSLQAGIDQLGFTECTPIQEQAIEPILQGKDVAGLAQTGTGKTGAFLIPLIERILRSQATSTEATPDIQKRAFADWKSNHFILVLVPTRELAEQVQDNLAKIASQCTVKGFAIYGGTSYDKQKEALRSGLQFIIATPGRLIDLYKEHLIDLKQVRAIVFDEADRMFDMGFKDDMKYILQRVPSQRQFLVFSATLNFEVLNTAYQFGAEPIELNISRDQAKAENVKDEIFHVGQEEKPQHLLSLLKLKQPRQTIIFSNFKHNVERIAQFLTANNLPAMAISSLLTQAQRTRVMQQFKADNDQNILVATDVAARGLDIQGVDLVINYDLPQDSESYVHRIGRTGRAGSTGQAYSLVSDRDVDSLVRIEEFLKHKVDVGYLEDKDLVKEFQPFPREESYNSQKGPRSHQNGSGSRQGRSFERKPDSRHPRSERRPDGRSDQRGEGRSGDNRSENRHEPRNSSAKRHGGNEARKPFQKQGAHKHKGKSHHQKRGASAPYRPPVRNKNASLGQKITGFFKRLFGN